MNGDTALSIHVEPHDATEQTDTKGRALKRRAALIGLAAAAVVAVGAGALAAASDWLDAPRVTPSRFADQFEQIYVRPRSAGDDRSVDDGRTTDTADPELAVLPSGERNEEQRTSAWCRSRRGTT
jgi:hypothetical protein